MALYKIGDEIQWVGSNEKAVITGVRERTMAIFYQVDNQPAWIPSRLLWNGKNEECVAFCSQLWCQRKIDLENEIEGGHYVKDEYGSPMCASHVEEIAQNGWNGYDPR